MLYIKLTSGSGPYACDSLSNTVSKILVNLNWMFFVRRVTLWIQPSLVKGKGHYMLSSHKCMSISACVCARQCTCAGLNLFSLQQGWQTFLRAHVQIADNVRRNSFTCGKT